MKWYEQTYINRINWILDHLEYLQLDPMEISVVLLIEFYNQNHKLITMDGLQRALHSDGDTIDDLINRLQKKKYLTIRSNGSTIIFDLSGLYEYEHPTYQTNTDMTMIDLIQQQFGTLLSMADVELLAQLRNQYGDAKIRAALREAMLYGKKSIHYMAAILKRSEQR